MYCDPPKDLTECGLLKVIIGFVANMFIAGYLQTAQGYIIWSILKRCYFSYHKFMEITQESKYMMI